MRDALPVGVDPADSLDDVPDAFRDSMNCSEEEAHAKRYSDASQ